MPLRKAERVGLPRTTIEDTDMIDSTRFGFEAHRRLGLLAAAVSLLLVPNLALPSDWPQWRGPKRDGISTETGWLKQWPLEGPKQLWKANVGVGLSSCAVSGGRLCTMGNTDETDTVYCFEAATGRELWKHSYPCSAKDPNGYVGPRCTPTIDGDRVYTLSRNGHFFCLEATTGKLLWSKSFTRTTAPNRPRGATPDRRSSRETG